MFRAAGGEQDDAVRALELAAAVLGEIRKKKSEEQRPLKTPVKRAVVRVPAAARPLLSSSEADLCASGLIQDLVVETADALEVRVELAGPESQG
jgi:hypothetical protein